MGEVCKDGQTRGLRGNAILTISVQGLLIDLVDVWHGKTFSRGKDYTGAIYQFKKDQIKGDLQYENHNDL